MRRTATAYLSFDWEKGLFELLAEGFRSSEGTIGLTTDMGRFWLSGVPWERRDGRYLMRASDLLLVVEQDELGVRLSVEGVGGKVKVRNISISFPPESFVPRLEAPSCVQLRYGMTPICDSGVFRTDRPPWEPSYGLTVLHDTRNSASLLLGTLGRGDCTVTFHNLYADPHRQGAFGLEVRLEFHCTLERGVGPVGQRIVALAGGDPVGLLEDYGRLWKEEVPPRGSPRVMGWNSWDFYGGSVSQKVVEENASAMKRLFPRLTHVVVDDGWQVRWGEWEAHGRFPGGLEGLARSIRRRGAVPGIWTAPYTMYVHCPFAFRNRDCLVRDEAGEPVVLVYSGGPVVLLDPTHPKVGEYIARTFRRLWRAGFRYFKIDFVQALMDPRAVRFHDPTMSRHRVMALALKLIRDAVPEAYIMSGTFPYEVMAGVVDAARVTGDIHSFWTHIEHNARQLSASFWMHGNLFNNDPDFLIVRSPTTSRDRYFNYILTGEGARPLSPPDWWTRGRLADEGELRVWASLVMLAGGEVICGDRLGTLKASGRRMVRTVIENLCDRPARPLDMFQSALDGLPPSYWLGEREGRPMLGIVNWRDRPEEFEVPEVGSKEAVEVWSGGRLSSVERPIRLAPRSAAVLRFEV